MVHPWRGDTAWSTFNLHNVLQGKLATSYYSMIFGSQTELDKDLVWDCWNDFEAVFHGGDLLSRLSYP